MYNTILYDKISYYIFVIGYGYLKLIFSSVFRPKKLISFVKLFAVINYINYITC